MKLMIPIVMAAVGGGLGAGAGFLTKPQAKEDVITCAPSEVVAPQVAPTSKPEDLAGHEFVKLSNQFVVPIVDDSSVAALVVMSVVIEVGQGDTEVVYAREPKLRDLFLQVLFDHASVGRFSGRFTVSRNLEPLRDEMLVVARSVLGDAVKDVLITDIARQDA